MHECYKQLALIHDINIHVNKSHVRGCDTDLEKLGLLTFI